uniref:Aldehyde dehydrogenase n=1 Tax=Sinocyclocheilus anshuiensis TaxID=1608454 RepID=A0A671P4S7_9TELE
MKNLFIEEDDKDEDDQLDASISSVLQPKFEAVLSEIDMVVNDLCYTISNLQTWMQPTYVGTNLATKLDDCFVRREPLGVVLVIGAWNYPLQLILLPLIGAIAADNCAILKPSEISRATEKFLLYSFLYLSQECYAVICGGAEETKRLLENRFDHIFYTGSQSVARCILQAAAVHLTPVTLELGGKCPSAAKRLVWAKFFNAGQSCVAPDYVLCTAETRDMLLPHMKEALESFYRSEPQQSQDMGRIVTNRHWDRLVELLKRSKGKIVIGGESDKESKYIAPTVVIKESDPLMQKEIFGPILPILTIKSLDDGINFINEGEKPLALYAFSDEVVMTELHFSTSSGGFCSNDGVVRMSLSGLPFGGVGASGMGNYQGWTGNRTFSHKRGCMLRDWSMSMFCNQGTKKCLVIHQGFTESLIRNTSLIFGFSIVM